MFENTVTDDQVSAYLISRFDHAYVNLTDELKEGVIFDGHLPEKVPSKEIFYLETGKNGEQIYSHDRLTLQYVQGMRVFDNREHAQRFLDKHPLSTESISVLENMLEDKNSPFARRIKTT